MGKGDIKSRKGKIANGSYGKKRKQRSAKKNNVVTKPVKPKKVVSADTEPEVKKTKKTTKRTAKKTEETPNEE